MNCIFCKQEMEDESRVNTPVTGYTSYACCAIGCLVNNDFPRYKCVADKDERLLNQDYALGPFFVRVIGSESHIYKLRSCMLFEEVVVPESILLNPENFERTLVRLSGLHYILHT